MDAYQYRPTPGAQALLAHDEHHTTSCFAERRRTPDRQVCFCDLPAHVKEIQDEARDDLAMEIARATLGLYKGTVVQVAVLNLLDELGFSDIGKRLYEEAEQRQREIIGS